jgi:c(7)-type cytochrome triheme protein
MLEKPEQNIHARSPHDSRHRRWLLLLILIAGCFGFILMIVINSQVSALTARARAESEVMQLQEGGRDFSKFTHTNPTHAQLPCLLCHRRENNSPRPTLPGQQGHLPCAGCHTQQFANHDSPICTICHTNVEAGTLKPFPTLKSFGMKFNHALHVTGAARTSAGCTTCHQPESRGVALSIPAGFNAHTTCFQCHAPRAQSSTGRDISSCGVCHQIGSHARINEWANAYKVNFSHARHGSGKGLSCNDCHNIRDGVTQARQVTAPLPLMHHASARAQSCLSCHNNKRAFGIENFGDCKKCHQGAHFYF